MEQIDKIPVGWIVKNLKDLCVSGGRYGINAPAVEYSENLYTYLRITDISDDGQFIKIDKKSVDDESAKDFILNKGIKIGDYVYIRKAGDVIPEVVGVELSRRESVVNFKMIKDCPICSETLVKKDKFVDTFCINNTCPARSIEGLIHFASRDAMNIEGLGERIIEYFYNQNKMKQCCDLGKFGAREGIVKRFDQGF